MGKSKLLHDWTKKVEGRQVLYLRDGAVWHPETAKEIPLGEVLVVADDAHRFENLEQLLALVRSVSERQDIKLILGARPSGTSRLDLAVNRFFDATQMHRFERLEKLGMSEVRSLAEEVLGAKHAQYAPRLAALSADTPLVTVVGGRLIARGNISPALLANEESFRRAVFDRFIEEYEGGLPVGPVPWRLLLNLISAVGPLRPRSDAFIRPAEGFLDTRGDAILDAINTLEKQGLLLRGGNLVRIVPDVLSDYLLEGACMNDSGEPTGFAKSVFDSFQAGHLTNILRNLAELDWRITQRDAVTSLLDGIWQGLGSAFEAGDAVRRKELVKSLEAAAVYQPERTMEIVRRAMESEAQPVAGYVWEIGQKDVLDVLPPLLESVAYHREHTREAVMRLWTLAKIDTRRPNQHPEHPARVVEELASYKKYKPVEFNERMADIAAELMSEHDAFDRQFTPLSIADALLKKEGEHHESDGITLSISGFTLNHKNIRQVRRKALALVEAALNSPSPRVASRAVLSLTRILSGFSPMLVRKSTREEHRWQEEERLRTLDIVDSLPALDLS